LSDTELSKEAETPVTRIITLPLRYEAEFNDGPYNATKDTFEIDQAVLPFILNADWALITRIKFPAVSQPPKKLGEDWASGLSNGYTTFFLSPEHGTTFFWGAGPVQWTVPIGGGIEKVFRLGGQHMKLSIDAYYNAIRPTADNDTSLVQVTLTLLFPP
jgi:hypothetical protein